jgi:hypothetical protein
MREGKALRFDISITTPDGRQLMLVGFASVHITHMAQAPFEFFKLEHGRMRPGVRPKTYSMIARHRGQ